MKSTFSLMEFISGSTLQKVIWPLWQSAFRKLSWFQWLGQLTSHVFFYNENQPSLEFCWLYPQILAGILS